MSELYKFTAGSNEWFYTDAKRSVVYDGDTYTPQHIERTSFNRRLDDDGLKITMPDDIDPIPQFLTSNPVAATTLNLMESDGTPIAEFRVLSVEFHDTGEAQVVARSTERITVGDIPPLSFSMSCDHALGDSNCGIDLDTDTSPGGDPLKVTIADASTISLAENDTKLTHADFSTGFDDGWWTGGRALMGGESVYVIKHDGTSIYLLHPFRSSYSGAFVAYAGCDKVIDTCDDKFGNSVNFGGCPFSPIKNPQMGFE